MTGIHLDHCEEILPRGAAREEWLRVRRQGIGGSDCSAVMGMNRFESPYTVWEDKTGRAPEVDETERMLWGNLLEPIIREEAMRRLGLIFTLPGTLRSLKWPWQQANLDGLASDGGIIECKNTGQWMAPDWDGQVPDHAELQCQHNMSVTGATHAWVAGLVGGCRLHVGRVDRDDDLIALIRDEEQRLWYEHILADVPPMLDPSEVTRVALMRRFGVEDRAVELENIDQPGEQLRVVQLAEEWAAGCAQEKAGIAAKRRAENEFRLLMGGANRATLGGKTIARITGGTWASKKFEKAEPQIAALYRKKVDVIDSAALRAEDPETWGRFQSQVFKAFPLAIDKEG
ncbi:YqaJ viral recombinase family protein [Nocardia abscessus]|uniref:YqaJ viral recombinase family nuclease n=1 Tax=Nocardia abscessus TaxID=120957 RepID=UPI002455382D|nr:YqaJ viral recombinase family protein [Nocardia abscessus]